METFIPRPIDVVFRASLDVDLHQLSMKASGEHIVGGVTHGVMQLGDTVTWRAKHFGIWWTMTSKITSMTKPSNFVDEQIQGPFRSFRHSHDFLGVEGGTLMTDHLDVESPALGFIVEPALLTPYLNRLIRRRNQAIVAVLTSGDTHVSAADHREDGSEKH